MGIVGMYPWRGRWLGLLLGYEGWIRGGRKKGVGS